MRRSTGRRGRRWHCGSISTLRRGSEFRIIDFLWVFGFHCFSLGSVFERLGALKVPASGSYNMGLGFRV